VCWWPCWALRWRCLLGRCDAVVPTPRFRVAGIVAAAAVVVAAATVALISAGADHRHTATPPSDTSSRTSPLRPGTAGPDPAATGKTPTEPAQPAASATTTAPPPSADAAAVFSLVVTTQSGDIAANVDSISVASNEPVDAPHNTAQQWNTAVWVKQSSYPSAASNGTSYVYGHACHHHVCSFTRLKDANLSDRVTVTTPATTLTYRITRIGLSPKTASSLPSWASDSTVPNRLVLVTCAFEQGDTSTDNIVVVAQLQST
jgi:LPXTG-site transpeptidase (sortase) family protein